MDSFEREGWSRGFRRVAGVDEAGRGPLAGPVVAAAVLFKGSLPPAGLGIRDSKVLAARKREELLPVILGLAHTGVSVVWEDEIDSLGVHRATLLAMGRAVSKLTVAPDLLLVDGPHRIVSPVEQEAIIDGDALSVSIASASVVAKTLRDRIMAAYHEIFPDYGFLQNKGYGTREHLLSIRRHGPSAIHRRSFKGVS